GAWGATLAALLTEKGYGGALWEFDAAAARTLGSTRRLGVLPDLELPAALDVTQDLGRALRGRTVIVSATPSHVVRSTMKAARASGLAAKDVLVVSVAKGLEETSHRRMSEIIREELGLAQEQVVVLSGPSHAEEVCRHLPTAIVAAGSDPRQVARVQSLFAREDFRVYPHSDLLGVELGGTLKNVFAIACGISDGLGVGDLIVTCLSRHSRNHLLGEKIGGGKSPRQALAEMTMIAEGFKTASSAHALAQKFGLDCPLMREVYEVLYGEKNPRASLQDLLNRETQA